MSDLHREFPEATEEEIKAKQDAALLRAGTTLRTEMVDRTCRECGRTFKSPKKFEGIHNKWTSLCGYCLRWEI